jgi:predicted outer membrane protein
MALHFQKCRKDKRMISGSRLSFVWLMLLCFCVNCNSDGTKKNVRQQNKDRFSDQEITRDANFIVNAVDESYVILEIAQLGENRLVDPKRREIARQIVDVQTAIAVKLKTFAEANDMAVQLSGPRTTDAIKSLEKLNDVQFETEWTKQVKLHYQGLMNDLVNYRRRAGAPLKSALDSAIHLMNENKQLILAVEGKAKD